MIKARDLPVFALQALPDGAGLTVHGKKLDVVGPRKLRDETAGHDDGLLVGQGHVFAGLDGGDRSHQCAIPRRGRDDHVHVLVSDHLV